MNTYELWKHEKYRDIAIKPKKIHYIAEKDGYKVKFEYYNIHTDRTMGYPEAMGFIDNIFIKKKDMYKWSRYIPLKEKKAREDLQLMRSMVGAEFK